MVDILSKQMCLKDGDFGHGCFIFFLGYCVRLLKEGNRKRTLLSEKRVGIWCIVFSIIAIYLQYQICFVRLGKMNSEYLYDAPIIIVWSLSVFLTILNLKVSNKAEKMVSTNSRIYVWYIFLWHEGNHDYFALNYITNFSNEFNFDMAVIIYCFVCCICLGY